MPCNDVTEILELTFDEADRLVDYAYNKRTCGQAVGAASFLLEALEGREVQWFIDADPVAFLADYPASEDLEEFLQYKHFFAIQNAARVLTGETPGGPNDACAAAEVGCDPETGHTTIRAVIKVDLITDQIRSCGGCKGCGKSTKVVFH